MKPPAKPKPKFTADELAAALAPIVPPEERPQVGPEPMIVKPPPPALPESGEAALERLGAGVRHAGDPVRDVQKPAQGPKVLRVVESDGTVRELELDPWVEAIMAIERQIAKRDEPWVTELEVARFPLFGVRSLELIDVEPAT